MTALSQQPRISDDLLELFASGVTLYVASRDAGMIPESVLGMGIRVHPDRRKVTVFVPQSLGAQTLANLADNGQIAVTLCHPPNHRTVQLKGRCTGFRDSTDAERELQEIFRAALVGAFVAVGIARCRTRGLPWWPSTAIDFEVADVFTQTPGPNAGARLAC